MAEYKVDSETGALIFKRSPEEKELLESRIYIRKLEQQIKKLEERINNLEIVLGVNSSEL